MITSFRDEYAFLSNFYPSQIVLDGILFPTVEHAYQSYKTLDMEKRKLISQIVTPRKAKRYGRTIDLRPDWEAVKLNVMNRLLRRKFRIPELKMKLLSTIGSDLVEGNTWGDMYWGCVWQTLPEEKWIGENHLGKLLMQIREEISNK